MSDKAEGGRKRPLRRSVSIVNTKKSFSSDASILQRNLSIVSDREPLSPPDEQTFCGVGSWQPAWLQRFATKKWFMVAYTYVGIVQGMFFSYYLGVISTVEKRFGISSKTTGILLSGTEVSSIIFPILLSYYAGRSNRPKWMAFGLFITSLAMFVMAFPHFIYGPGVDILKSSNTTSVNSKDISDLDRKSLCDNEEECKEVSHTHAASIIIFFAFFLHGIGGTCYYTLGIPYMDDSVTASQAPIYLALTSCFSLAGPFLGFMMAYACLNIFVVPGASVDIDNSHPNWIGAWWLGFIINGALLTFGSMLILLFPFRIPTKKERKLRQASPDKKAEIDEKAETEKKESIKDTVEEENVSLPPFKELPGEVLRLLKNPIVLTGIANSTVSIYAFGGFYTFMSKYIEMQFRTSAATSSLYTGFSSIFVRIFGILLSGIVIMKFKPAAGKVAGYNVLLSVIQLAGFLLAILPYCDRLDVQGSVGSDGLLSLENDCNIKCGCSTDYYNPVCHLQTNISYLTPCYACCNHVIKVDTKNITQKHLSFLNDAMFAAMEGKSRNKNYTTFYLGCSCLTKDPLSCDATENLYSHKKREESYISQIGTVVSGYCPLACNAFIWYTIILGITKAFSSTGGTGSMLLFLRCVDKKDKAMIMGIFICLLSVLAVIPYPIVYGAIIDSTCLVWKYKCGEKGNCAYYDTDKFRYYLHGTSAAFVAISCVCDAITYYYARHLNLYEENEGNTKKDKQEANSTNKDQI